MFTDATPFGTRNGAPPIRVNVPELTLKTSTEDALGKATNKKFPELASAMFDGKDPSKKLDATFKVPSEPTEYTDMSGVPCSTTKIKLPVVSMIMADGARPTVVVRGCTSVSEPEA